MKWFPLAPTAVPASTKRLRPMTNDILIPEVMAMKPAALLSTVLLGVVALAHLLRLVLRIEIIAAGKEMPMWVSVIGFLVPAALAAGLWREGRRT